MDLLNQEVATYWWSYGKKIIDFKGTVADCLKHYETLYFETVDENNNKSYNFTFHLGSNPMEYKGSDFNHTVFKVLAFKLVYLGDKAQIKFNGYDQKFNWR